MTNEEMKNIIKNKVLNSEELSSEDIDNLFNLFTEEELTTIFPKEKLNNILNNMNNTSEIKSPKDICNALVKSIVDAFKYCNELPYVGLDDFREQTDYVRLIGGFQLFANNFISSVDNLNEGKTDKDIIKFVLPVED